jgi:Holliday junction resolvase
MKQVDKDAIRRWRKRGFYTENALVKLLQKNGYNAVRVPVSNPSLNPLPDIMARRASEMYAFEVKNAKYYAYFPKQQIEKLFRFLNELVPVGNEHKHAVLGAHLGKRWIFKEINWKDYEKNRLPEKARILKRDRGNFEVAGRNRAARTHRGVINNGSPEERRQEHADDIRSSGPDEGICEPD